MNYLFFDAETLYNDRLTLKKMTLRNYLSATRLTGFAAAENTDTPVFFHPDEVNDDVLHYLRSRAADPDWTLVAHNIAFDMRVWHYLLHLPYPIHKLCTMELAHAAYPGQPGGYSLAMLARTLDLGAAKISIDLTDGEHTRDELATYCIGDVELCRTLFYKCLPRVHPDEIKVAEMCNDIREHYVNVDTNRVLESVTSLSATATAHAIAAVGDGDNDAFGWDGDVVRSVKPQTAKKILLENFGFDTPTISFKKLNSEKLRENPEAASYLKSIERTNKTLSNRRRVGAFVGAAIVDLELGYFRAHTGRFSSPQPGGAKGINLHNLPKRDKALAKAIRTLFRLPDEYCTVRVDLANAEYRMEAWLTGCEYARKMFDPSTSDDAAPMGMERSSSISSGSDTAYRAAGSGAPRPGAGGRANHRGDGESSTQHGAGGSITTPSGGTLQAGILADPYAWFWYGATGQFCSKTVNVAARQLAKAAVLGLGYGMGLRRFVEELCKGLADPSFGVSLDDLRRVAESCGWVLPRGDRFIGRVLKETSAPEIVVCVAYHVREQFHKLHPEFQRTANWLDASVAGCIRGLDPEQSLSEYGSLPTAPDPSRLSLLYDRGFGPSVHTIRAVCGLWPTPTVTWRDLCFRETKLGGWCLHCMHSAKGYRPLTRTVMIENVTQSAARNALCLGQLRLRDMGYKYQLSVHDEILLVVPRDEATVRRARADLLSVFGPGNSLGYGWAVCIDPSEINVSQSMYETATDWNNLDLEHLP